ncbi:MAG TPA: hypothetical protein VF242_04550 [Nitrososphaeraceae archaeon]
MNEEKESKGEVKGDIIEDYDSVLRESSVLTSVSGIIKKPITLNYCK